MTIAKKSGSTPPFPPLDKAYVPYSKFPVGACLVAKMVRYIKESTLKMPHMA